MIPIHSHANAGSPQPAGKVAKVIVEHVVKAVVKAWGSNDQASVNEALNTAMQVFVHPTDLGFAKTPFQQEMMDVVRQWATENRDIIHTLDKNGCMEGRNKRATHGGAGRSNDGLASHGQIPQQPTYGQPPQGDNAYGKPYDTPTGLTPQQGTYGVQPPSYPPPSASPYGAYQAPSYPPPAGSPYGQTPQQPSGGYGMAYDAPYGNRALPSVSGNFGSMEFPSVHGQASSGYGAQQAPMQMPGAPATFGQQNQEGGYPGAYGQQGYPGGQRNNLGRPW